MEKRHYFVTALIKHSIPGLPSWDRIVRVQKTIFCEPENIVSTLVQDLKKEKLYSDFYSHLKIETIQPL